MLGLKDWRGWFVFVAYIALFVNNTLLVTATKSHDNQYNYSTVLVVLLIDFFKLAVSTVFYLYRHTLTDLVDNLKSSRSALIYYLIPSGLYCIFNNLVFLNLVQYDPTTYTVLLQFSIVITGLVYQYVFQRQLSWVQWASLAILTCGCILTHVKDSAAVSFKASDVFILAQVMCSSFAGVYSEYLLKSYSSKLDFWLQNIIMYAESLVCNSLLLVAATGLVGVELATVTSMKSVCQPLVIAIICNNVTAGLVTGVFLIRLNSIIKKFAVAIQMVILAVVSKFFLGKSVDFATGVSILLVSFAIVIYTLYPVKTQRKELIKQKSNPPVLTVIA